MENKYKNLIKDTFVFAIGNIGSKMILFFLVPLYTNCLTPSEYGIADLVFTLSQFLIPIVSLVIYHSVMRFGLSKHENPDNVLLCGLIVSAISSILTILITPLVGLYGNMAQWKWYFCIYVILQIFLSVFQNYAKAIGKNKTYSIVSILYTLVLALLNIAFLLWRDMGVHGYLLANVIATGLVVVIFLFVCKVFTLYKRAKFDKDLLKRMLKYCMPLVIDSALWWLIQSSNKIFVELFLGAETLGFYTAATKIPALMYVVVTIFSQAWGISTVKETEDVNDSNFYKNVFSVYSCLTFGICISIISFIKPFMSIYVGNEFFEAWRFIPLLLVGNAFLAIADFFGAFYNALKKTFRNMLVSSISAIISVSISILCLRYIGMWAAVLSTFFAYFAIMWVRLIDIKKYISIKINWFSFLVNQFLVLAHAIFISLDFNIYIVSGLAVIAFIIVNFKFIKNIFKKVLRKVIQH